MDPHCPATGLHCLNVKRIPITPRTLSAMQRERIATFSQGSGWKIRISIIPTATFGRLMLRKAHASAKMIQKTVFGRAVA